MRGDIAKCISYIHFTTEATLNSNVKYTKLSTTEQHWNSRISNEALDFVVLHELGRKVKLFSDKIILIFYYISKYTIPHTVVLLKTEYELSGVSMQISSCEVSEHTFLINFSYIE